MKKKLFMVIMVLAMVASLVIMQWNYNSKQKDEEQRVFTIELQKELSHYPDTITTDTTSLTNNMQNNG